MNATGETNESLREELEQVRRRCRALEEKQCEFTRTAQALKESEELFHSVVDHLLDAVLILDWNGTILFANRSAAELVDLARPEDGVGRNAAEFVHPDYLEVVYGDLLLVKEGKGGFLQMYKIRTARGIERWVEGLGTAIRFGDGTANIVSLRDITARKETEAQLEKLSRAVEQSPVAVVITDTEGLIEYVNPTFVRVTQYTAEEVLGKNPRFLKSGDRTPEEYRVLWQTITAGRSWRGTFLNRKKGGDLYWASASISPITSTEGRLTHFLAIEEDITAMKKTEEDLRQARDAANTASRAKSDFLASMSHEIRTPLNAVIGMTDLLWETPLTPEQRQYVGITRTAGENLLSLISDILDLSKVEAGRLMLEHTDFSLPDLTGKTCEIMTGKAEAKGLALSCHIAPDVPPLLRGDPVRLRQILTNLLGNAVKFTEKGEISLAVQLDAPPDAAGNGRRDRMRIAFSVRDTGIGIPADKQESIFERFVQADSSTTKRYGGTGLGLTISRQLVELMGGRISVESEPGKGSTFSFVVPLAVSGEDAAVPFPAGGPQREKDAAGTPAPGLPARTLRILLADDSEDNRLLIQAYLRTLRYTIDIAENGREALGAYRRSAYDLVLMDMQMPVMDGYTAVREIRQWERETGRTAVPIIALTAYALKEDIMKSLEAGCNMHLTKPVKKSVLLDAIARHSFAERTTGKEGRTEECQKESS